MNNEQLQNESFEVSYLTNESWGDLYEMIKEVCGGTKEGDDEAKNFIEDVNNVKYNGKPVDDLSDKFDLRTAVQKLLKKDVENSEKAA